MLKIRKMFKKKSKGFTLVELVVVIAILAILAAIAVPKVIDSLNSANESANAANVRTLESAATLYYSENQTEASWDGTNTDSSWKNYLQAWPEVPSGWGEGPYTVTITATGEITVDGYDDPGEDD